MGTIRTPGGLEVPEAAIRYTFVRSGGPGGQHVNTTSTKAQIRIDLDACGFDARIDALLRARYGHVVRATGGESRSQWRNRSEALERALAMIDAAVARERPRVATRATRGSRERRLADKAHRARRKSDRRWTGDD